jgi:hypothetical protein
MRSRRCVRHEVCFGLAQIGDNLLEALDRCIHGLAHLGNLILVFHQAKLRDELGERRVLETDCVLAQTLDVCVVFAKRTSFEAEQIADVTERWTLTNPEFTDGRVGEKLG